MITCPTAAELQTALDLFDASDTGDGRRAFLARVADNARAVLERETAQGSAAEAAAVGRLSGLMNAEGQFAELNHRLCDAIRAGEIDPRDPALLAHLRACAIDRIAIDQPNYSGLAALLA